MGCVCRDVCDRARAKRIESRARGRGLRGGAPERRRRRGGDWPFGAERATGRPPAGPARPSLRPQPRTSEPERSYPRPAHGGGLKKTWPCARPRRSTPGEVGPPVVAVGGGPRHIGARRAEGPGRERGWRSYSHLGAERSARAGAISGGAGFLAEGGDALAKAWPERRPAKAGGAGRGCGI